MNETTITQYISETFEDVDVLAASGDWYFFYQPDRSAAPDHRFPFATLVTGDRHDSFSNLGRPGVYRLNIGVSKATFRSRFGEPPEVTTDFTVLDRLMPHPVYGSMYWISVLNPSAATFEAVKPLLAEAHGLFVQRRAKARLANESGTSSDNGGSP